MNVRLAPQTKRPGGNLFHVLRQGGGSLFSKLHTYKEAPAAKKKMARKSVSVEQFLRLNKCQRVWLKLKDRRAYRALKFEANRYKALVNLTAYCPPQLGMARSSTGIPTFKHSGNAGDIIYALPALKTLAGTEGGRLFLALNVPIREKGLNHPLGGVQLNQQMFEMIRPLLIKQPYLKDVLLLADEKVDYDLDTFRDAPLMFDKLGISRWYFYMFGIACDLSEQWLHVTPDTSYADTIVTARSARYRNHYMRYDFLRAYPKVAFIGLYDEYKDFCQHVPHATHIILQDFLQMAQIIAGCRLFIGNQSFPFSVAEALKVTRVVELDPNGPNVVPTGSNGYDVLFQKQMEYIVGRLMGGPV